MPILAPFSQRALFSVLVGLCFLPTAIADGPKDNDPKSVRAVPPVGIEIEAEVFDEYQRRARAIRTSLSVLDEPDAWKCHVEVFACAVEITLETKMVYGLGDLAGIKNTLGEGERRLRALASGKRQDVFGRNLGKSPLIVGGFRSKIDDSVQPFGVELPPNWGFYEGEMRLDVWLHGRGERVSEVKFLQQRSTSPGQYQPKNTIVLHPYGRYSNAFKFVGEIDVLEAIECVKQLWPVDETRITIRGFSMGGAGCWQWRFTIRISGQQQTQGLALAKHASSYAFSKMKISSPLGTKTNSCTGTTVLNGRITYVTSRPLHTVAKSIVKNKRLT